MRKYSDLTIIFSNCLSGGTAWNSIRSMLMENLYKELSDINGLEFKLINSNTVRGEHNSFTLIFGGVYYELTKEQSQEKSSTLLEFIRNAANRIQDLSYSEIRIENVRHWTIFNRV
jgi:hypothetical protein